MSAKSSRARKAARQAQQAKEVAPELIAMKIGDWQLPRFNALSAAFGAAGNDYPPASMIPDGLHKFEDIASTLFFKGGKLSDHGIEFKPGIERRSAMTAIQALLCSFAPKHEIKTATVAWALSEWTQPIA